MNKNKTDFTNGTFDAMGKISEIVDEVYKRAYQSGYEYGKKEDNPFGRDDAIALLQDNGWLDDHDDDVAEVERERVWKCVTWIIEQSKLISSSAVEDLFDAPTLSDIVEKYSVSEVMCKVETYVHEQSKREDENKCDDCKYYDLYGSCRVSCVNADKWEQKNLCDDCVYEKNCDTSSRKLSRERDIIAIVPKCDKYSKEKEQDGCVNCMYEYVLWDEYPCNMCKNSYVSKWKAKN